MAGIQGPGCAVTLTGNLVSVIANNGLTAIVKLNGGGQVVVSYASLGFTNVVLEYGFREPDGSEKWGHDFDWEPLTRREAEVLALHPGRSLISRELICGPTIDLWPEDEEAR